MPSCRAQAAPSPSGGVQPPAGLAQHPAGPDHRPATFVRPRPGWARAAADFDARVFGPDAWPYAVWVDELAAGAVSTYRALIEDGGVSATPSIIALGGIRGGIEAEVLTIGVAPSHRGQGLGGLLLDELLSLAAADGAEEVFLEVRSRGEVARRLYESRGFVTVGLRRGYYRDDDALIMRLAL
ncbi:MAG: GNAT family N-acetyltransferase [Actinomycetaceae bacterium]|nr:GNAT family N-acetyltransferase [Actinomycetaceae bacterium]